MPMTPSYHSQALMKSLFALGEKACQLFERLVSPRALRAVQEGDYQNSPSGRIIIAGGVTRR
jgi:hypothetical protein